MPPFVRRCCMTRARGKTFPFPVDVGACARPGRCRGGVDAVYGCDADMDFCGLAVRVSCGGAVSEGLGAPHLCPDPASGIVFGPAFPDRPSVVARDTEGFGPGDCGRAVHFPRSPGLADRDDRGRPVDQWWRCGKGACHRPHRRSLRRFPHLGDMVWPLRQHWAAAVAAGGKLHRPDVWGDRVDGRCTLHRWRRPGAPCLRACHSPSPGNLTPVQSAVRFNGPSARR